MKIKLMITALAVTLFGQLSAQIDMSDSSAQIIGYWHVGEEQVYDFIFEKFEVSKTDTVLLMSSKYEIVVTIKDSTEHGYTVEWLYQNVEVDSDDMKLYLNTKLSEGMSVVFTTDQFGTLQEVINLDEIKLLIDESFEAMDRAANGDPDLIYLLKELKGLYMSDQAIEALAIKDVSQFYAFHGGRYILNEEIIQTLQLPNNFGGDPFDVYVSITLEELNEEDDNCVLRAYQEVDSEQMIKATFEFMKMTGFYGDDMPDLSELPTVTNKTWSALRIQVGTGWPIYAVETKEISAGEGLLVAEERVLEKR